MKIVHISDTHGKHRELTNLPDADMIIHSGDFTFAGTDNEAIDFMDWYCDLPYMYKIFIAGNHDVCMLDATIEGLPQNVYLLNNTGVTIEGVKIYGVPMFAVFDGEELKEVEHYEQIPDNTDILITHRPPLGILDSIDDHIHYGSSILLDKVSNIKPRMHLFGHVHSAYRTIGWKGITFCNAGLTDWKYDIQYSPQLLEINI